MRAFFERGVQDDALQDMPALRWGGWPVVPLLKTTVLEDMSQVGALKAQLRQLTASHHPSARSWHLDVQNLTLRCAGSPHAVVKVQCRSTFLAQLVRDALLPWPGAADVVIAGDAFTLAPWYRLPRSLSPTP
jgi:hypothetical protein